MAYIDIGKKEGSKIVAGGNRAHDRGYYIQPTVISDCHDNMTVAREEVIDRFHSFQTLGLSQSMQLWINCMGHFAVISCSNIC